MTNTSLCTPDCKCVLDWVQSYFALNDDIQDKNSFLALLDLRSFSNPEEYLLRGISSGDRSGIRKALRHGWTAREMSVDEWNSRLIDVYEINTSATVRQGGEMNPDYFHALKPEVKDRCFVHGRRRFGAFDPAGVLVGYMVSQHCGQIVGCHRFLGHAARLREADFMRLLWFTVVSDLICNYRDVFWAWYHLFYVGTDGLVGWKASMGLRPMTPVK